MSDLKTQVEVAEVQTEKKLDKPTMHPVEQYCRNISKMSNPRLSRHLRRRARKDRDLNCATAIILSIMLDTRTHEPDANGPVRP